ncbi:MAG TPA: phosphoribosylaminoimidazolesuccinocarboxamide synthase [Longimicrobiales bacterium]
MMNAIAQTALPFPLVRRGKVRDVYDVGDDRLLIVATDRISAFDVVMPQPIPDKGAVLTQITAWWLQHGGSFAPNHLISAADREIAAQVPALRDSSEVWSRRAMLVRRTQPVAFECVVRGYLAGSAWKEYRESGTLAGEPLPAGLSESARLDEPIFSPAIKAEEGHDENITFQHVRDALGEPVAQELRTRSLAIYSAGLRIAEKAGVIIADTKFEFGHARSGELLLIDEVLTPDSSRFWPQESYAPGGPQQSLDKQPVRDYLEQLVSLGQWHKQAPGPDLPDHVIQATSERYRELFRRMTGRSLW